MASKLIKLLKKHHVRSDYDVIRLAYDDYLTRGPNKSEENMKKAKPIYYIKTSKFNPQIEYSKILISEANFRKLKKCQGRTTEQLEDEKINLIEKKKNCLNALINTCCPLDELGENNDKMKKLKSLKSDEYLNNLISKETEEEVLSQSSEDDQIYDHKKSNKPKNNNDGELGEAFNDILVNNIIKNNKDDENIDLVKDLQNLKNLKAKDLDPRIWNALKFYDFTDNLGVNEKQQIDLLKVIFKMFALGDRKIVNMPWIDYVCFKELLRLSKIIPCDEIPDFMIDLTYTQFTNNNSSEFCNPIVEYNLKEILARIAEMKYPDDLKEDAYNKLLRFFLVFKHFLLL